MADRIRFTSANLRLLLSLPHIRNALTFLPSEKGDENKMRRRRGRFSVAYELPWRSAHARLGGGEKCYTDQPHQLRYICCRPPRGHLRLCILLKFGWHPRRTVHLASWDAKEVVYSIF
ncbi:hypothetical protein BC938DRAFT_478052 [Jimgerdemannia flammicorona]|uniref:Uncharacterized protein n=1 Tax=Jimgerdemannia flammicorona TaxID=994334 RepID=A0A433QNH9_9FUNG|nr:hypothetical protein BC938DRAFT_478052 [Jimgerdemannia flammicorona]